MVGQGVTEADVLTFAFGLVGEEEVAEIRVPLLALEKLVCVSNVTLCGPFPKLISSSGRRCLVKNVVSSAADVRKLRAADELTTGSVVPNGVPIVLVEP